MDAAAASDVAAAIRHVTAAAPSDIAASASDVAAVPPRVVAAASDVAAAAVTPEKHLEKENGKVSQAT